MLSEADADAAALDGLTITQGCPDGGHAAGLVAAGGAYARKYLFNDPAFGRFVCGRGLPDKSLVHPELKQLRQKMKSGKKRARLRHSEERQHSTTFRCLEECIKCMEMLFLMPPKRDDLHFPDMDDLHRFRARNEAALTSRLLQLQSSADSGSPASILRYYGVNTEAKSYGFITMERMALVSFKEIVEHRVRNQRGPRASLSDVVDQTADEVRTAVVQLHAQGIVHGDVDTRTGENFGLVHRQSRTGLDRGREDRLEVEEEDLVVIYDLSHALCLSKVAEEFEIPEKNAYSADFWEEVRTAVANSPPANKLEQMKNVCTDVEVRRVARLGDNVLMALEASEDEIVRSSAPAENIFNYSRASTSLFGGGGNMMKPEVIGDIKKGSSGGDAPTLNSNAMFGPTPRTVTVSRSSGEMLFGTAAEPDHAPNIAALPHASLLPRLGSGPPPVPRGPLPPVETDMQRRANVGTYMCDRLTVAIDFALPFATQYFLGSASGESPQLEKHDLEKFLQIAEEARKYSRELQKVLQIPNPPGDAGANDEQKASKTKATRTNTRKTRSATSCKKSRAAVGANRLGLDDLELHGSSAQETSPETKKRRAQSKRKNTKQNKIATANEGKATAPVQEPAAATRKNELKENEKRPEETAGQYTVDTDGGAEPEDIGLSSEVQLAAGKNEYDRSRAEVGDGALAKTEDGDGDVNMMKFPGNHRGEDGNHGDIEDNEGGNKSLVENKQGRRGRSRSNINACVPKIEERCPGHLAAQFTKTTEGLLIPLVDYARCVGTQPHRQHQEHDLDGFCLNRESRMHFALLRASGFFELVDTLVNNASISGDAALGELARSYTQTDKVPEAARLSDGDDRNAAVKLWDPDEAPKMEATMNGRLVIVWLATTAAPRS
eukprot:g19280.t1